MNLRIFIGIPNIMITEQLRQNLGNFLGKKTDNIVENGQSAEGQSLLLLIQPTQQNIVVFEVLSNVLRVYEKFISILTFT